MAWTIKIQPDAEHDLALISDFLFHSYLEFGDAPEEAYARVTERIHGIQQSAFDLAKNPFRGTKREELGRGVRNITQQKAVIWFQVDEPNETVNVLAFFFGGQDHIGRMLERLLSNGDRRTPPDE